MWHFRRTVKLSIPTPCRASWDGMAGDMSRRFCESCRRSVHDFSELTRSQAEKLLRDSPGGVCGKVSMDTKGTVVFRRDPEAGAMGRAIGVSLLGASALAAQTPVDSSVCRVDVKISDVTGAPVKGSEVNVTHDQKWQDGQKAAADANGLASYTLPAGSYDLRVDSPGFSSYQNRDIKLSCSDHKPVDVEVTLNVGLMGDVVVVSDWTFPHRAWFDVKSFFLRHFRTS